MGIVFKPVTDGSNLMDDVISFLIDDFVFKKFTYSATFLRLLFDTVFRTRLRFDR